MSLKSRLTPYIEVLNNIRSLQSSLQKAAKEDSNFAAHYSDNEEKKEEDPDVSRQKIVGDFYNIGRREAAMAALPNLGCLDVTTRGVYQRSLLL